MKIILLNLLNLIFSDKLLKSIVFIKNNSIYPIKSQVDKIFSDFSKAYQNEVFVYPNVPNDVQANYEELGKKFRHLFKQNNFDLKMDLGDNVLFESTSRRNNAIVAAHLAKGLFSNVKSSFVIDTFLNAILRNKDNIFETYSSFLNTYHSNNPLQMNSSDSKKELHREHGVN